jgi:hypothetical protein
MAAEIVFSRERAPTSRMVANVRFESIGVVRSHVSFEIECPGECCGDMLVRSMVPSDK